MWFVLQTNCTRVDWLIAKRCDKIIIVESSLHNILHNEQ